MGTIGTIGTICVYVIFGLVGLCVVGGYLGALGSTIINAIDCFNNGKRGDGWMNIVLTVLLLFVVFAIAALLLGI